MTAPRLADIAERIPFRIRMTVRFRRVTAREGVLLRGPAGWGEWSPFPQYPPQVTATWLEAALEAAVVGLPARRRRSVPVNCTVPAVGPEQAHAIVSGSGCGTAKVKVAEPGQAEGEDLARVEAVRDALGPGGKVRVDANGAWDVQTADRMLGALDRFGLEYAEQPVATLEEMAQLRRRTDVRLAADESVRTAEDPLRVAGLEAADIVVLKAQPLGGVRRALAVAEAAGLAVVVSSALETSVGLAAGVALAASLPELRYANGLGTRALLDGDVVSAPLAPVEGALPVEPLVVAPSELDRWRLDGPDADAVLARLEAAEAERLARNARGGSTAQ